MHIIVVSDTHLSPRTPEAQSNWDTVVRHVSEHRPDLVLHLGDLTLDGSRVPEELQWARKQLERLPVPWRAIPGNHDIGDLSTSGVPKDMVITEECHGRWLEIMGPDCWRMSCDGWTVLAIDALLLDSGFAAEEMQWRWLEDRLRELAASRERLALVTHKPVIASEAELSAAPPYMYTPPAARQRLMELLRPLSAPIVLSGHIHQYRVLELDGISHLWAPTTWAVLPEKIQPTVALKSCGVLDLTLGSDGHARWELVKPDGLRQYTLLQDIPDPYRTHGTGQLTGHEPTNTESLR